MSKSTFVPGFMAVVALFVVQMPVLAQPAVTDEVAALTERLDVDRVVRQLREFSDEVGNHPSGAGLGSIYPGSNAEADAVEYIAGEMRRIGLTVHVEPFPARQYEYGEVRLLVDGRPVPAISVHAGGATWGAVEGVDFAHGNADDGRAIRAELVDVGYGGQLEYQQAGDVTGKAVLVRRNLDWPAYQVLEAAEHGAVAVIFYDFPGGAEHAIKQDSLYDHDTLPSLSISLADARRILTGANGQPIEVIIENRMDRSHGSAVNVYGVIEGSEFPDEWILISAHYDRWWQAAGDNAAGIAALLELARVLVEGPGPRRSVLLLAVGAEESGGAATEFDWATGSFAFFRMHPDILGKTALALNIDVIGWTSPTKPLEATAEIRAAADCAIRSLGESGYAEYSGQIAYSGDAWVYSIVAGASGANLHPIGDADAIGEFLRIYHTQLDRYHEDSYRNIETDLRIYATLLSQFDDADLLPILLSDLGEWVEQSLESDASAPLPPAKAAARDAARKFTNTARAFEAWAGQVVDKEETAQSNRHILRVRNQIKPWLYTMGPSFLSSFRSVPLERRLAGLERALSCVQANDRECAVSELGVIDDLQYAGRYSPGVFRRQSQYRYTSGDWSAEYAHKPPAVGLQLAAAYRELLQSERTGAAVQALRTEIERTNNLLIHEYELLSRKLEHAAATLASWPNP